MAWLMFILNLLSKPHESASFLASKFVGIFLLLLAGGCGLFFLFQGLAPRIGYLESGAVITALLAIGGCLLLFLCPKKKTHPLDEGIRHAQDMFNHLDLEHLLKNNSGKMLLFSFGIGLMLSQIKDIKKLSDVIKLLK